MCAHIAFNIACVSACQAVASIPLQEATVAIVIALLLIIIALLLLVIGFQVKQMYGHLFLFRRCRKGVYETRGPIIFVK